MTNDIYKALRFMMGILAFGSSMFLIYLSGSDTFTLDWEALIAMMFLVTLFIYGPRETKELIEAWRKR